MLSQNPPSPLSFKEIDQNHNTGSKYRIVVKRNRTFYEINWHWFKMRMSTVWNYCPLYLKLQFFPFKYGTGYKRANLVKVGVALRGGQGGATSHCVNSVKVLNGLFPTRFERAASHFLTIIQLGKTSSITRLFGSKIERQWVWDFCKHFLFVKCNCFWQLVVRLKIFSYFEIITNILLLWDLK